MILHIQHQLGSSCTKIFANSLSLCSDLTGGSCVPRLVTKFSKHFDTVFYNGFDHGSAPHNQGLEQPVSQSLFYIRSFLMILYGEKSL